MYEKMKPLVSVIIPVYNNAEYLRKCVKSICTQSYAHLQIIIVDDGSDDESEKISDGLADEDDRITVIHIAQSGVSHARNVGIDTADGEYVIFADSDDYTEKNYIEMLVSLYMDSDDIKMVMCGYYRVINENQKHNCVKAESKSLDKAQMCEAVFCDNDIGGYLWNKMFAMDIIRRYQLRFRQNIQIGEDMLFIAEYISCLTMADKANYLNQALYNYRVNQNSAIQKMYLTRKFDSRKLTNLDAAEAISELFRKISIWENSEGIQGNDMHQVAAQISKAVEYRCVRTSLWVTFNMILCRFYDKKVVLRLKKMIRANIKGYLRSGYGKKIEKAVAINMYLCPTIFLKLAVILIALIPNKILSRYLH